MRHLVSITTVVFLAGLFSAGIVLGEGRDDRQSPYGMQDSQPYGTSSQPQDVEPGAISGQTEGVQQPVASQQLSSDQVRQIQQALKDGGFDPGEVDGIMGPETQQALQEFQQDQGIAASGEIDQDTLEALDLEAQEFMGVSPEFGESGETGIEPMQEPESGLSEQQTEGTGTPPSR